MKDVIYRQDAINAVCKACYIADDGDYSECEAYNRPDDDWCEELVALRDVPSAEPERKKGKWIGYTDEGFVECPFCHSATNCDDNKDELHYCFSCGADMRGEQSEKIH